MTARRSDRCFIAVAIIGALTAATGCHLQGRPVHDHATVLADSYAAAHLPAGVGVALLPVGAGADPLTFGDQTPAYAWSTMKVPLALAAQRYGAGAPDIDAAIEAAIVDSDNDAALVLRQSLGTPDQARERLTAVLREGGDPDIEVPAITGPDELFGLTRWSLAGAARFTAHLPCLAGTATILGYMREVSEEQQWGLLSIEAPGVRTAVKGGWGESDEVRQLGLITWPDGGQLAVTMLSYRAGETTGEGIAELNQVAHWLQHNLELLPRGRCPAENR